MFNQPDSKYSIVLEGQYNWAIVLLSLMIAWLGSYVAISLNKRVRMNSFFHRDVWLFFSSVAMGIGIWAMHFIGMSAYQLPIEMKYNHIITILSIFPAVGASFIAFHLVNRLKQSLRNNIIASVLMGFGIAFMHYLGMYSMLVDAQIVYQAEVFILSIIIAVAVSFFALYAISAFNKKIEHRGFKLVISLLLASAVSMMHYVAMFGTTFYVTDGYLNIPSAMDHEGKALLIAMVAVSVSVLLLLLMVSIYLDRYIDYRIKFFDTQTNLPNGRYYEKEIQKNNNQLVLAVWQINSLKAVNYAYSYNDGDKLVNYIANTLKAVHLPNTMLYRLKEDQFAFLMYRTDRLPLLERKMQEVARIWDGAKYQGKPFYLQSSCAIASVEQSKKVKYLYNDAQTVFKHPSTLFQQEVAVYRPSFHLYSFEEKILADLDQAMDKNELFLVYQPKIHSDLERIAGVEALVRWNHPEHGFLSPATFIPIIEKTERITDLTDWVIENACKQLSDWQQQIGADWTIAINIPGDYVSSARLVNKLKKMQDKYQVEPRSIELELTETRFVQSIEEANHSIAKFRSLGFSVALDDFGTGLSSLSYLKKMEISTLKMDKSFVDQVPQSPKDASILKAMIDLGQSLGLAIVVEGIETEDQVTYLRQVASSLLFQGFYFAKPMKAAELLEWSKKHYLH